MSASISYIAAIDHETRLARSVTVCDNAEVASRRLNRIGGVRYTESQAVVAVSNGAYVLDDTRWTDEGRDAFRHLSTVEACRLAVLAYCEECGIEPDEDKVCIAARKATLED